MPASPDGRRVSPSPTPQLQHASLELNLKTRVCDLAGTSSRFLTADAAAFLQRRVTKWIESRKFKEADLQKAAEDMKRRYPKAFPPPGHERTVAAAAVAAAAAAPAQQTLSSSGVIVSGPKVRKQHLPPRASTTEPTTHSTAPVSPPLRAASGLDNLTPSRETCRRPQVISRLQRLNADREWNAAAQADARAHEEARQRQLEERIAKQAAVRRDMEEAAKFKELQREQERREREENRRMVIDAMAEVKQHERDVEQQRRAKFAREKAFIEEQREARRVTLEKQQAIQRVENAQLRKQMEEELQRYQRDQHEKAVAIRDSLLDFLSESKQHLELKRRREEEQKRRDAEADAANLAKGGGGLDRGSAADAVLRAKREKAIKARAELQEKVATVYDGINADRERQRQQELERLERQVAQQQKEVEERNRRDAEKARKMRDQLVSSLDVEIQIHQQRKEQEEREKEALRRIVDAKKEAEERAALAEQEKARERQRKLLDVIDKQLNDRFEAMLKPQQIKITSPS